MESRGEGPEMDREGTTCKEEAGTRREIYRYLGYGKSDPDSEVVKAVDECLSEMKPLLVKREIHRVFPLRRVGEDAFSVGEMVVKSRALSRNLRGCEEVCLMAATIGFAPDRLAARYTALRKMSRAVIVEAAGAALIEDWCDEVNGRIRDEAAAGGLYVRPRFSPGYGDFGLAFQTDLFRILAVQKTIGVTLADSLAMMPSKSVTAVIGLADTEAGCVPAGCEACGRAGSCPFCRL